MKRALAILALFLPWPLKRWVYRRVFHYEIDSTARIGFSLIMPAQLKMGPRSRIGHLNLCKGLQLLDIGEASTIGRGNWITGFPVGHPQHFAHDPDRQPSLRIGSHSAITHRHLIDCTNQIQVGSFTTIAGYQSQFLTHSIDVVANRQDSHPISIGDYCFVGTNVVILGGASLPNQCVLGAKSLLNKAYTERLKVYGGVPARAVADLPEDAAYMNRQTGFVW